MSEPRRIDLRTLAPQRWKNGAGLTREAYAKAEELLTRTLAVIRTCGLDPSKVNPMGGAACGRW